MLRKRSRSTFRSWRWPLALLCGTTAVVAGIGLSLLRDGGQGLQVELPPFFEASPRQELTLHLACRNESFDLIRIVGMRSICTTAGCASSDAVPLEIGAAERQVLTVEFVAPREGEFDYPLTLYYQQNGLRSLTIPIRGVVKQVDVGTSARVRKVEDLRRGAMRIEEVTVAANAPGKIAQWRTSCECVTIRPGSWEVKAGVASTVRANIDMSNEDFEGELGVLCQGLDESGKVLAEFELRFEVVR